MKSKIFAFCLLTASILSCNLLSTARPTPTPPTLTSVAVPTDTSVSGNVVRLNNVSMTLPRGLAKDALTEMASAVTDENSSPWWEIAPAHLEFTLTSYQLQDTFHQPMILVYPAEEYARLNSVAAEQIDRLKQILAGSPMLKETLPHVPVFNAGPVIAADIKLVEFQSGRGVREVTQYDQYPAPVNNHELFYHFEGLTDDGSFYVVAVLPITAPILAEDDDPAASVPTAGVPIPTDVGPNDVYYASITEKLNSLSSDAFTPSLTVLDELIQSMLVTNP